MVKHKPLVIVGPSGVGKGTIINRLMQDFENAFGFVVSHTMRDIRQGEKHGVHYHFTHKAAMEHEIHQGKFLEKAEVHGNYYGTSRMAVEAVMEQGKICLLDIDVQGLVQVKEKQPLNSIFIAPPNMEELKKRLVGRNTETPEQIEKRLNNAVKEIEVLKKPGMVDHIIVNDNLEEAYLKFKQELEKFYPHLKSIKKD